MAPQLDTVTRTLIKSMLRRGLKTKVIASLNSCSTRAVQRIRWERDSSNAESAPPGHRRGRRSCITPCMQQALTQVLEERPDMYRSELVEYLQATFNKQVSERSISRALQSMGWTRTTISRVAQQRSEDLRDLYLHTVSKYRSYHFIFVDESGCDRRAGHRRWGWSPKGTSPVQVARFSRGQRWHILPAYAQEGVIIKRVYQGATNTELFEDFIEQLIHHCGRYPEPRSVIVMDNATWHNSEKIRRMCKDAGVILEYLPPYSPDFNPIEEFFGVLKKFIKKNWYGHEHFIQTQFEDYLKWCIQVVGGDESIAQAHFRHAGIPVEDMPEAMETEANDFVN